MKFMKCVMKRTRENTGDKIGRNDGTKKRPKQQNIEG